MGRKLVDFLPLMKTLSTSFGRSMLVLTAALLGGAGCQQAQAQSPGVALTTPAAVIIPTLKPELTAAIVAPVVKSSQSGAGLRIKTGVTLTNKGAATAANVTVVAYLSDDGTLSSDDTNVATLKLSDYKTKGNLKPGKAFTVPLSYHVPAAFVDAVQGKYLIFVATADDFTATATAGQAVFGPITLP